MRRATAGFFGAMLESNVAPASSGVEAAVSKVVDMRNVYLTGFSGAGKSTLAAAVARARGMASRDLDAEIVAESGLSIPEIFAREGERSFRVREAVALRRASCCSGTVIATGGGVVLDPDNRAVMRSAGWVVWLDADEQSLLRRVRQQADRQEEAGGRPLLAVDDPLARIRELKERRRPHYAHADIRVDTTGRSVEETVRELCAELDRLEGASGTLARERMPVEFGRKVVGRDRPLVCVPLVGTDASSMVEQAIRAARLAPDLAEVRADYFTGADESSLKRLISDIAGLGLSVLLTNRRHQEGGARAQHEPARLALLHAGIVSGALSAFDIELATAPAERERLIEFGLRHAAPAIVSFHDFNTVPDDETLDDLFQAMEASGASVGKLAVTPRDTAAVARLLRWCRARTAGPGRMPLIVLGMGAYGLVTRITGHLAGSALTYAATDHAGGSAPGQPTVTELRSAWDALRIGFSTER